MSNPFKGAEPYEEGDKLYGREHEVKGILNFIRSEVLTFIFARSGTGKSSLIKASLIGTLKDSYYWPVYIHLNQKATEDSKQANDLVGYIIELIIESLEKIKGQPGYELYIPDKILADPQKGFYSLFDFIEGLKIVKSVQEEGEVVNTYLKPVLLFDQFEEIFTLDYGEQKESLNFLLTELDALIENRVPAYLVDHLQLPENATKYQELKKSLLSKQKNFRILFSFREEYMPDFESLKSTIPYIGFTTSKFRLEPFSTDTGVDVITSISPEINKRTAELIANNLAIQVNANFDKQTVDPFLLSLICQKIYDHIIGEKGGDPSDAFIQNLVKNAIEEHIDGIYKRIRKETKVFIEDKLITSDGRRTSYNLKDARHNAAIADDIDLLLGNTTAAGIKDYRCRLLNSEQLLDTLHLDILHDRLVPPLEKKRDSRKAREGRLKRRKVVWIVAAGILVAALIGGYFIQYYKGQSEEFTSLALFFKAGELKEGDNPIEAYSIYKKLAESAPSFGFLDRQLKKVDFGDFDIPSDDNKMYTLKNNYILSYTSDSLYRLWRVDSKNKLTVCKEYPNIVRTMFSEDNGAFVALSPDSIFSFDAVAGKGSALYVDSSLDRDSLNFCPRHSFFALYMDGKIHFVNTANGQQASYPMDRFYFSWLSRVVDTTSKYVYCQYSNRLVRLNKKGDSLVLGTVVGPVNTATGYFVYMGGDSAAYLKNGSLWKVDLLTENMKEWLKGKFNEIKMTSDSILYLGHWEWQYGTVERLLYSDIVFYNLHSHLFTDPLGENGQSFSKFSVNTGYTKDLVTNPSGDVLLLDIRKPGYKTLSALKNVLAYDITDDGKKVLYVKEQKDTTKNAKVQDSIFLFSYDIRSGTSSLIDSISADDHIVDTSRIYGKYFFRTNTKSDYVVYKRNTKDGMLIIIRDLLTGAILYQSTNMDTYVDNVDELDFTDEYIHLRNKSNDDGIMLLNGKPRNWDYFSALGWPIMADSILNKVQKKYLMQ